MALYGKHWTWFGVCLEQRNYINRNRVNGPFDTGYGEPVRTKTPRLSEYLAYIVSDLYYRYVKGNKNIRPNYSFKPVQSE